MSNYKYEYAAQRVKHRDMLMVKQVSESSGTVHNYSLMDVDSYEKPYHIACGDKEEFVEELDALIGYLQSVRQEVLGP